MYPTCTQLKLLDLHVKHFMPFALEDKIPQEWVGGLTLITVSWREIKAGSSQSAISCSSSTKKQIERCQNDNFRNPLYIYISWLLPSRSSAAWGTQESPLGA